MSIRKTLSDFVGGFERSFEPLNVIEISRSNILHNIDLIQKANSGMNIFPVLKANAYGHGISQVASILKSRKFKYVVVDGYFEALKIWEVSKQPVLLIGVMDPKNLKNINFKNTALTVYDLDTIRELGRIGKKVRIHLKVDTGMRRQGIDPSTSSGLKAEKPTEFEKILLEIKKYRNIELEGLMSHFSDADNPDMSYTRMQRKRFKDAMKIVKEEWGNVKYIHFGASAGSLKMGEMKTNSLRMGLAMYGYNPYLPKDRMYKKYKDLKPALTLRSRIINDKEVPKGEKVGYGCTFTTERKTRIGVLPLGYYEGVDRRLSNKGSVKFKNKYLPILGRVSMNLTTIDLTGTNAKRWSKVEVISSDPKEKNSVENLAKLAGTIPYVTLCKLDGSIRRVVVD
jgi:alanine racemase